MKFITKVGVTFATITMVASTISYAGTVSSGQLDDFYIGASYENSSNKDYTPNNSDAHYDVHWMTVDKSDQGILTVKINSNFIGFDSRFKLGDLFLMNADADNMATTALYQTAASCNDSFGNSGYRGCDENSYTTDTNQWEYAFDLGLDLDSSSSTRNSEDNYVNESGILRSIDTSGDDVTDVDGLYHTDVNTSSQLKSNGVRGWQIVDVKGTADAVLDGNSNPYVGDWSTNTTDKLLTMSFDISGTSLMTADQIALRWAMSCANDIIEVVADLSSSGGSGGGTTPVPEPSTLLLMSLAGFGLFSSRRKKV